MKMKYPVAYSLCSPLVLLIKISKIILTLKVPGRVNSFDTPVMFSILLLWQEALYRKNMNEKLYRKIDETKSLKKDQRRV